jgi:hypothetical protein
MSDTQHIARDGNSNGGRRWHDVLAQPRRRIDLKGFKSTLWMGLGWVILVLALVFPFPWWW